MTYMVVDSSCKSMPLSAISVLAKYNTFAFKGSPD